VVRCSTASQRRCRPWPGRPRRCGVRRRWTWLPILRLTGPPTKRAWGRPYSTSWSGHDRRALTRRRHSAALCRASATASVLPRSALRTLGIPRTKVPERLSANTERAQKFDNSRAASLSGPTFGGSVAGAGGGGATSHRGARNPTSNPVGEPVSSHSNDARRGSANRRSEYRGAAQ